MRPCFGCAKELLQARVHAVYYLHDWQHPDQDLWKQYLLLQQRFPGGVHRVDVADPDAAWALSARRTAETDTGHTL
jgi:dCMP deaminase